MTSVETEPSRDGMVSPHSFQDGFIAVLRAVLSLRLIRFVHFSEDGLRCQSGGAGSKRRYI
jgi:hypothetical protein